MALHRADADLPPSLFTKQEWQRLNEVFALSPRMLEITQLIMRTAQDKQIASILGIRSATIRNHIAHIFHRLGVSSRNHLMYYVFSVYRKQFEDQKSD